MQNLICYEYDRKFPILKLLCFLREREVVRIQQLANSWICSSVLGGTNITDAPPTDSTAVKHGKDVFLTAKLTNKFPTASRKQMLWGILLDK